MELYNINIIIARIVVFSLVGGIMGYMAFLAIQNSYLTWRYFIQERCARLRCRKCQQLFNLTCLSYNHGYTWYESQGHINNPHCKCHDIVGHDESETKYIEELRLCQPRSTMAE